jgi:hypothetical protein
VAGAREGDQNLDNDTLHYQNRLNNIPLRR